MQPQRNEVKAEGLTPGARAVRSLDLQEIQRRLEASTVARRSANEMAIQASSLADEHSVEGRHQQALSNRAVSVAWRSRVVVLDAEIAALKLEERQIQDELAAPTAEQRADMDETMGAAL